MKVSIPKELMKRQKGQSEEEYFEKKCKFYSEEVKNHTQQKTFLTTCRYGLVGINRVRKWNESEREYKINVLSKYFPEEIDYILRYEKEQNASLYRKKENLINIK